MPNWCWTDIKFYSKDEELLRRMYKDFKAIEEGKPTQENDFGNGWMGDFANHYFPEYGAEKVECRGRVDGIDEICERCGISYFTVWTETAWGPKMAIWYEIVKRFYSGVEIAYSAEEAGCGLFLSWDKTNDTIFFPETYWVDGCLPKKGGQKGECVSIDDRYQFGSEKDIIDYLDDTLPFDFDHSGSLDDVCERIEGLLEKYEEEHESDENLYFQVEQFIEEDPSTYQLLE